MAINAKAPRWLSIISLGLSCQVCWLLWLIVPSSQTYKHRRKHAHSGRQSPTLFHELRLMLIKYKKLQYFLAVGVLCASLVGA